MKFHSVSILAFYLSYLPLAQCRLASSLEAYNRHRQTQVIPPELTTEEVEKIESDLGIILSPEEKLDIASIAKAPTSSAWRTAAEDRIETHRKANLNVQVTDEFGNPLPSATVLVKMRQNSFKFGGIMKAIDFGNHGGQVPDLVRFKDVFRKLFNSAGLENEFKPKYAFSFHNNYVPDFMAWAQENDLPVRGHNLIWPGQSKLPSSGAYDILTPYNALQAALADSNSTETLVADLTEQLRDKVNFVISDWVSQWDGIYEWDVLNEPIGNTALQAIFGHEETAEWFKIAAANVPNGENCKLMVNQWGIISMTPPPSTTYNNYRNKYMNRIDYVINGGGRLDRIGFQSRVKRGYIHPSEIYNRIEDFAVRYGLEMVGTEFEVVASGTFAPTELDRAVITEEWLTTYFSHPLMTGLNAWTYQNNGDPKALTYFDGTIKLNGLVWYYLHRIKYSTDETVLADEQGAASVRAFKGDYDITVELENGVTETFEMTLEDDTTFQAVLGGLATPEPTTASPTTQEPTPSPDMKLFSGVVDNVSTDAWTTVNLPNAFTSMVVVTTPVLASTTDLAVITRVRDAAGSSFRIKLQNPVGATGLTRTVHYLVVEEGVYNQNGLHLEALKVASTGTARKGVWGDDTVEEVVPLDSFVNPVVLGQVMTENDPRWSVFWSRGSASTSPADSNNIFVGKHIAADTEFDRLDETLGVILVETATDVTDNTLKIELVSAGIGADSVRGVSNSPPYNYSFQSGGSSIPQVSIATQAAQDGNSGSWAVLYGSNPIGTSTLSLAVDEDTAVRRHTTEQVGYIILA